MLASESGLHFIVCSNVTILTLQRRSKKNKKKNNAPEPQRSPFKSARLSGPFSYLQHSHRLIIHQLDYVDSSNAYNETPNSSIMLEQLNTLKTSIAK